MTTTPNGSKPGQLFTILASLLRGGQRRPSFSSSSSSSSLKETGRDLRSLQNDSDMTLAPTSSEKDIEQCRPVPTRELSALSSNQLNSTPSRPVPTRELSVLGSHQLHITPSRPVTASGQSEKGTEVTEAVEEETTYPEGGKEAWSVVLGSFCSMVAGFGILNSVGALQAYISENQLKEYDESTISWIFSIYIFITFFCGLQIGPIFDMYGPKILIIAGSVCTVVMLLLLGLCTEYYHFILTFSLLGGLGASLLFTPAVSAVAHWFNAKRGTATGLAATGGSFGGIIFPLLLQSLLPKIGWAWSTRILALICLTLCILATLLVRSRLPPKRGGSVLPSFRIFMDGTGAMAFTTAGIFFIEWGLFVPLSYLTQYAQKEGVDQAFSYQLMAIFAAGSCIGRYVPGYVADRWGRFNTMLLTVAGCVLCVLAFWLPCSFVPQRAVTPLLITFSLLFGFSSGSNISLTPICVGQLCDTQEYGRYYATCYTIVSFGSLTGLPIAGALIQAAGGEYWGVVVFTAGAYVAAFAAFAAARVGRCGWKVGAVW